MKEMGLEFSNEIDGRVMNRIILGVIELLRSDRFSLEGYWDGIVGVLHEENEGFRYSGEDVWDYFNYGSTERLKVLQGVVMLIVGGDIARDEGLVALSGFFTNRNFQSN